ncbi:fumarylacetoacetate hydrolase family protein [Mycobacterium sp. 134]|uniref:fumarylacetoacetate hydrolase family protein n=1 Tax=Mycobacterium sp. 134 TaxID=3400425 RepID=UPI003AAF11D9
MVGVDAVTRLRGVRPGKVIAVHANYPSRAAQRGTRPANPSYFFKPSSSLAAGGTVGRPEGTQLLGFEGEIALVIGIAARNVVPERGWAHVGWVTAANDLGLYDMRAADRGSNARSKGADGYTPLGPTLLDASAIAPEQLRVRTWVDDVPVQEDTTGDVYFPLGFFVADLSRFMTLEVGDIILTGTPAGASVVHPGQVVEVEVDSLTDPALTTGRLRTAVVETPALGTWGSLPRIDDDVRAAALGTAVGNQGKSLSDSMRSRVLSVGVATLSAQLRRRGLESTHVEGVRPVGASSKFAGPARTLRYVAFRPDLFRTHGTGFNPQKRAVEHIGRGEVLMIEARGDLTAGTIGDILALRAQSRGAAAVVTDGAVRDASAIAELEMPVFSAGRHPAVLGRRHVPWETDVAIVCGGATVVTGDIVVGDEDGVVVIPSDLLADVVTAAEDQERQEQFIAAEVAQGASIDGLYPLGPLWKSRYDALGPRCDDAGSASQ